MNTIGAPNIKHDRFSPNLNGSRQEYLKIMNYPILKYIKMILTFAISSRNYFLIIHDQELY